LREIIVSYADATNTLQQLFATNKRQYQVNEDGSTPGRNPAESSKLYVMNTSERARQQGLTAKQIIGANAGRAHIRSYAHQYHQRHPLYVARQNLAELFGGHARHAMLSLCATASSATRFRRHETLERRDIAAEARLTRGGTVASASGRIIC
jgi:hypothetical protein